MKKKEAIDILSFERDHIDTDGYSDTPENAKRIEAYNIAIEALQREIHRETIDYEPAYRCRRCQRLVFASRLDEHGYCNSCVTELIAKTKEWKEKRKEKDDGLRTTN